MPRVPPGSSRFRHFDNDRLDHVKHIQHGRDKISAQLVGQHAAILHLEVFHQGVALCLTNTNMV
ncbi:MAG TPA: hypothetical protein VF359_02655 [Anaerolineales bacterium]